MMKKIIIKTKEQIDKIRESGKYLTELLQILKNSTKPGVSLIKLEQIAQDYITKKNIKGAFKGYNGFPTNLCLSVNNCVVHGIPDDYILKDGDLLKIDCGINYLGGISDSAISIIVGGENKNIKGAKLIQATKIALDSSLKYIGPGKAIYDFSENVYKVVKSYGFNVIKNLTGHGVGVNVHEGPFIYNYPTKEVKNIYFQVGMVIALEPITAEKSDSFIEDKKNGWNLYTKYGDLGAQREYTVCINDNGYEILAGIV